MSKTAIVSLVKVEPTLKKAKVTTVFFCLFVCFVFCFFRLHVFDATSPKQILNTQAKSDTVEVPSFPEHCR